MNTGIIAVQMKVKGLYSVRPIWKSTVLAL